MEEPRLIHPADRLDRKDALVLCAFALFLLIFFAHILVLPGEMVIGRAEGDARSQFYPWRAYGFGQVRQGHFPLWNPYEFLGMPFVATLQSAMFYPFNWLCAVLPVGRGINLGLLLNLFCSGAFMYLWCRRLKIRWQGAVVAMFGYVFCAQQFMRLYEGHWSFLAPMAFAPGVLLFVEEIVRNAECRMQNAEATANGTLAAKSEIRDQKSEIGNPSSVSPCLRGEDGWRPLAVAGGALAVAMQWFGGNPQYLLYTGIAALMYLAGRLIMERARGSTFAFRAIVQFGGIYLLGTLLAAAQVFPAVEMLGISSRKGQLTYAWIAQYRLPPENLVTLISPDFFGGDVPMRYWGRWNLWECSAYIGVVVFALSLIGLWRGRGKLKALAGVIALFFLLMALATPLLWIFYETLPGFDLFRSPGRYLFPFSLFMALLAGIGMDALLRDAEEEGASWRIPLRAAVVSALVLGVAGSVLAMRLDCVREGWFRFAHWMLNIGPGQRLYLPTGIVNAEFVDRARLFAGLDLIRTALLLAGLAGALFMLRKKKEGASHENADLIVRATRRSQAFTVAVMVLLVADTWSFAHRYLVAFDPRADGLSPGAVSWLREKPGAPFRFIRAFCWDFSASEGMDNSFSCLEGVQPNVPARFRDLFWTLQGKDKAYQTTVYSVRNIAPTLLMLNVRYFVQYKENPIRDIDGLKVGVYQDERIRIDELPEWWPRAWLVHNYTVEPAPDRMLQLMTHFNYSRLALFEADPRLALSQRGGREPVPEFTLYEPNRLALTVRAAGDAILVLSELHYPGWEATVDGRPVEILRANYAMRAVAVPAGEHRVELVYRPASFRYGLVVSGIGLVACVALAVTGLRRRRRNAGE